MLRGSDWERPSTMLSISGWYGSRLAAAFWQIAFAPNSEPFRA